MQVTIKRWNFVKHTIVYCNTSSAVTHYCYSYVDCLHVKREKSSTVNKALSKMIKAMSPVLQQPIYIQYIDRSDMSLAISLTDPNYPSSISRTDACRSPILTVDIVVDSRHIDIRRLLVLILHRIARVRKQRRRWQSGHQIDRSQGWLCQ